MSDLDLNYLATESTKEDRDKLKDENLLNAHRENIETILSALDKELHLLKKIIWFNSRLGIRSCRSG